MENPKMGIKWLQTDQNEPKNAIFDSSKNAEKSRKSSGIVPIIPFKGQQGPQRIFRKDYCTTLCIIEFTAHKLHMRWICHTNSLHTRILLYGTEQPPRYIGPRSAPYKMGGADPILCKLRCFETSSKTHVSDTFWALGGRFSDSPSKIIRFGGINVQIGRFCDHFRDIFGFRCF